MYSAFGNKISISFSKGRRIEKLENCSFRKIVLIPKHFSETVYFEGFPRETRDFLSNHVVFDAGNRFLGIVFENNLRKQIIFQKILDVPRIGTFLFQNALYMG